MNKVIFLTGGTGFLGGNLISRILKGEPSTKLILLVRGNSDGEAWQRLDQRLMDLSQVIDIHLVKKRIKVIKGDITLERLGLSESLYSQLAEEVTHIIHCAATVQLRLSLECARSVNFIGTKNVMEFANCAQEKGKLQRVAHLSTAYISGKREGRIYEEEFDCGQQFSNTYQQTKFESEEFVRGLMEEIPITIFRPSIVVGDSKTGKTTSFNVLYVPLKLINRGLLRILPGSQNTPIDVVPVDFVCDAIDYILLRSNEGVGKTFHLTVGDEKTTTVGEIVELSVNYFNHTAGKDYIPGIRFLPLELYHAKKGFLSNREKRTLQAMEVYKPHLCLEKAFDNTNTRIALRGTNIVPPEFKIYYKTILRYCIETNWGKQMKRAA